MREINKIIKGKTAVDGAGVKLVRVFGYYDVTDFDPFLMMDAFDSVNPSDYIKGFPWHPHRGIETVTYLIEGIIEHGDSLGNKGVIKDGDCQWMTGGSGIIHQEMPKPANRMLGVQLWLNLPAKNKMTNPEYRDIINKNIPVVSAETSTIKIISGTYLDTTGALEGDYVKPLFMDIDLKPNQEFKMDTSEDETVYVYIIAGSAYFGTNKEILVSEKQAVLFTYDLSFQMKSGEGGTRLLFLSGKPLKEPIAWGGPIVMNTREELNQAFQDLDNGKFINR